METSFIVVGHVDTGKSTLCGHLLKICGAVENWDHHVKMTEDIPLQLYSSVLDIYDEERERGKTNQYDVRDFTYKSKDLRLIDTPGHKQFIRSMIEGVSLNKAKVAVLVVSAKDREFGASMKGGQTIEDVIICKSQNVEKLIVAINKMDTCNWDAEKSNKIQKRLDKVFKILKFDNVVYVECSGYGGQGLDRILDEIVTFVPAPAISEQACTKIGGVFLSLSKTLICSGFMCIAHIDGKEYHVELIVTGKQKYARADGDKLRVSVTFPVEVMMHRGKGILIRSGNITCGIIATDTCES